MCLTCYICGERFCYRGGELEEYDWDDDMQASYIEWFNSYYFFYSNQGGLHFCTDCDNKLSYRHDEYVYEKWRLGGYRGPMPTTLSEGLCIKLA